MAKNRENMKKTIAELRGALAHINAHGAAPRANTPGAHKLAQAALHG